MKIKNEKLEVELNNEAEIVAINFYGQNIMHDGKKHWQKIYPMIFPVIGFSTGFEVDGVNYQLPKHGFWKKLLWNSMYEGQSISFVHTVMESDQFPFSIDIQHNISLDQNNIEIKTIFSNIGKNTAYFHFGHHPAFKIDDSAAIIIENNKFQQIALDGKLKKDQVAVSKVALLDFGTKYDTLVQKEWNGRAILKNKDYQLTITAPDFSGLQLWKPQTADFICLEPWEGYGDKEYDAPSQVEDKIDIIKLNSGEVKAFTVKMNIKK